MLSGCGGDSTPDPTSTPRIIPTSTPTPTATLPLTPPPTSTPYPTPAPPLPTGRVRTRLFVECTLGEYGLQVRVLYGATILDTEDPAATIVGVRIYMDGALVEDTGPLSHRIYVREIAFAGRSNNLHTIQMHVKTWAAPQPADLIQLTQCPSAPDKPLV